MLFSNRRGLACGERQFAEVGTAACPWAVQDEQVAAAGVLRNDGVKIGSITEKIAVDPDFPAGIALCVG